MRWPISVWKGTLVLSKCFCVFGYITLIFKFALRSTRLDGSYWCRNRIMLMQIFFFFRSPFYFSFFWISIFVLHFLTWVMIFYGDPLLPHWGSSFWIDVEWTFPSFLLRAFLPWDHRSDGNTVSWCPGWHTRDACAQNSEPRFKSMLLVGLLIPT